MIKTLHSADDLWKTGAAEPSKSNHELGHAIGYHDDGPDRMNNVNANENPIREQLGLPLRTGYIVPEEDWVPGTN